MIGSPAKAGLSCIAFSPRLDFVVSLRPEVRPRGSVERKPLLSVKPRPVGGELHSIVKVVVSDPMLLVTLSSLAPELRPLGTIKMI